ncbi:sulfatase family protein [Carboxylicivirga sp. RSCT41]|uniref:sulfatase family protein n=1 Tax=Carboxylicivirga agarovorans TaxID=3417570 RepID=UPI003D34DAA6
MRKILTIIAVLTIAWSSIKAQKDKPNVIIIFTDDQGSVDLNCYGTNDLKTPNLDNLAGGGVRFNQFYAGSSVCSPSRATLLTGKTNLKAGLPGNVPIPEYQKEKGKTGLPAEQVTIAEMLKANGYYTALIGKWHLGHSPEQLPNAQGFDYFFGHERGCIDNYSHFFYWAGPNKHDLNRNHEEVYYPGQNFGDLMVKEMKQIINEKDEEPFFVYWAFNAPHYPYQGSVKWLEYYKDLPMPRREYAAFLSTMDEQIGQVLDELDSKGLADNTIVIFQSDQGHSTEERAFWGGGNAGPYRGCKFTFFEGGIRVPAIIRYPGVIPGNELREQMASGMDWLPTIAELTGSEILDNTIEGKSLMPIIRDAEANTPHDELHWQVGSYDDQKSQWAVRKGDWKLYANAKDPETKKRFKKENALFLINLKDDIAEQYNLAGQYPEKVQELKTLHEQWLHEIIEEGKY